jgi:hypothetical protein
VTEGFRRFQEDPVAGRQRDDLNPEIDEVDVDGADANVASTGEDAVRSDEVEEYWDDLDLEVVEIALPRGVGLTLRQYRVVEETDTAADDDDDEDAVDEVTADAEDDEDRDDQRDKDSDRDSDEDDADEITDLDDEDEDDEDSDDENDRGRKPARTGPAAGEEEVVMLTTERSLHLFRSPEGLVAFVKSGAPHDLSDAPGWDRLVSTIEVNLVVPDDEDRYELDLVVDNLRGGPDVWERDLIVGAGEIARDVAYACRLPDVLKVLAPGSPLDDLDEALRKSGFFARRKLRRLGRDQVSLGWRTVIGKMSSAVTWHD